MACSYLYQRYFAAEEVEEWYDTPWVLSLAGVFATLCAYQALKFVRGRIGARIEVAPAPAMIADPKPPSPRKEEEGSRN